MSLIAPPAPPPHRPQSLAGILYHALHRESGDRVPTQVCLSVHLIQADIGTDGATVRRVLKTPPIGLSAFDHVAYLHEHEHVWPASTALGHVTPAVHVDPVASIDMTQPYEAAVLYARMGGLRWYEASEPIRISGIEPSGISARFTTAALQEVSSVIDRLLMLPAGQRQAVVRTVHHTVTTPGTQQSRADMLRISRSTLRSHLDAVGIHPDSSDLTTQQIVTLAFVLPALAQVWPKG